MESLQILARAHDLAGEFGITRGAQARMDDGVEVSALDSRATSFCSIGLIVRAALDLGVPTWTEDGPFRDAVDQLLLATGSHSVIIWNDYEASDDEIKGTFAKAAGIVTAPHTVISEPVHETLVLV